MDVIVQNVCSSLVRGRGKTDECEKSKVRGRNEVKRKIMIEIDWWSQARCVLLSKQRRSLGDKVY